MPAIFTVHQPASDSLQANLPQCRQATFTVFVQSPNTKDVLKLVKMDLQWIVLIFWTESSGIISADFWKISANKNLARRKTTSRPPNTWNGTFSEESQSPQSRKFQFSSRRKQQFFQCLQNTCGYRNNHRIKSNCNLIAVVLWQSSVQTQKWILPFRDCD